MLDQLPVRYHWAWMFQVTQQELMTLRKGETVMDQKQREKELKGLRKLREAVEEGQIGKALVLVTRIIQEKSLPEAATHLTDAEAAEKSPYYRTPASGIDEETKNRIQDGREQVAQAEADRRFQEAEMEERIAARNMTVDQVAAQATERELAAVAAMAADAAADAKAERIHNSTEERTSREGEKETDNES